MPNDKVVQIKPTIHDETTANCIAMLEYCIEEVKERGAINAGVIMVFTDDNRATSIVNDRQPELMLSLVDDLKAELEES